MTIASTTSKASANGNGSATSFSFSPVTIFAAANLVVTKVDSAGVETPLSQGTGLQDYLVVVASYPGTGSITYPNNGSGVKLQTGETIVMRRVLALTQSVHLTNQGGYFPEVQEGEFDYLTSIDQQQQELIDRSVKTPIGEATTIGTLPTKATRALQVLGFDAGGDPIAVTGLASATVSSAMAPVVASASLDAAIQLLGVSAAMLPVVKAATIAAAKGMALLDVPYHRSVIAGLGTARPSTTTITIAPGYAADEIAQTTYLQNTGTLTLNAATTGANGLDAGSLANNTWYHVFVIGKADGTVAAFGSTNLAPTLPSGYTLRRRVWSAKTATGAATLIDYSQFGDECLWLAPPPDIAVVNQGTTAILYTLSTPLGVKTNALLRGKTESASIGINVLINSPDETSIAGGSLSGGNINGNTNNTAAIVVSLNVRTNTNSQVRAVAAAASTSLTFSTVGYIDARGRFA